MNTSYTPMEQWFTQPPGSFLLEAESALLSSLLPRLFGYHLLQMGGGSDNLWLKNCRIPHRIHLSPVCPCQFDGSCIIGNFNQLPLLPDSIDVVLLPHVLEFTPEPKAVLQQAYDVLTPEGYIVILGFHPWSLWGLYRLCRVHKQPPWSGKFYNSYTVRSWLREIGYTVENHRTLYFRPPLNSPQWNKKLRFLDTLGQFVWPYLGGVHVIVAKKRVLSLTPLHAKLKLKRLRVSQVAQPTVRMNFDND